MAIQNYYFNNLDAFLSYDSFWDFNLTDDERDYNMEVIYNSSVMYYSAGTTTFSDSFYSYKLPVILDLNDPNSSLQIDTITKNDDGTTSNLGTITNQDAGDGPINPGTYYSANTLVSKMAWSLAEVTDGQVVEDIALTGIDNGLTPGITGSVLTLETTLPTTPVDYTFNPLYYDYRLKLHSVTGYTSFWDRRLNGGITSFINIIGGGYQNNGIVGQYVVNSGNYTPSLGGTGADLIINVTGLTITDQNITIVDEGNSFIVGETITINDTLLGGAGATTLILQVGGVISGGQDTPVTYGMRSNYDRSGFYYDLYGGFFQGFFDLWGYGYRVLPDRQEMGWTVESLLKVRSSGDSWNNLSGYTLNNLHPNNEGIFFYLGARAENKFWNCFHGETGYTTTLGYPLYSCSGTCVFDGLTGSSCGGQTGFTYDSSVYGGNVYTSASTEYQILSNNFALRLSGGSGQGYKLGYRVLRYTGDTNAEGYAQPGSVDIFDTDQTLCTGGTFTSGFTIEEQYTTDTICTGETANSWFKVDAVWKRNYYYGSDREKLWRGGLNLITNITCETATTGTVTATTGTTEYLVEEIESEKIFLQNPAWIRDIKRRLGTLTLYVNSRPVLKVPDFEEIIPRRLNEVAEKQIGVPYNISFGGGSQGLYDSLTLSGTPKQAAVLDSWVFDSTNWTQVIFGALILEGFDSDGVADPLRVPGAYLIGNGNSATSGNGDDWSIAINVDAVGLPAYALIAGGFGFLVGDTITIPDASLGGGGATDVTITLTSTSTGIVAYGSDGATTITSSVYNVTSYQTSTIFYDNTNYNHPIVQGETYDVILKGYSISGNTANSPANFDLGVSGITATAPNPVVTYLAQNEELSFTSSTIHRSYKATETGNIFVGVTPNSGGEIVIESLVVSKRALKRDPADENMLIEENFGGTYMGGISQMRFYNKPLDASELKHNYYINTERYGLIDCDCGNDNIFVEGCDTEYATYNFPVGQDTISLSFGQRMVRWDTYTSENVDVWVGTSNGHPLPRRYSSVEPYCCKATDGVCNGDNYLNCQTEADCISTDFGKCSGVWYDSGNLTPDIVKFPFTSVPEKPMTITITRIAGGSEAKITFTGKRVR
tara:strand:+ start:59567 stop:62896 length:3330 start_codon:yes stop_codon:yes gene_type:complete